MEECQSEFVVLNNSSVLTIFVTGAQEGRRDDPLVSDDLTDHWME